MESPWIYGAAKYFSIVAWLGLAACAGQPALPRSPAPELQRLPALHPRPSRSRPVIAVIGSNQGTELSDLLVPFGILSRDKELDVRALSTDDGIVSTFTDMGMPGPLLRLQGTTNGFDAEVPAGADYVIVPALTSSPGLIEWLKAQVAKGATLVSICNGALVVAQTGLFEGYAATAHWSTEGERKARYPGVRWTADRRYIIDGAWMSTTGVSAAVPASLALIEVIHGQQVAARIAAQIGAASWSPAHDTHAFHPRIPGTAWPLAKVAYANRWLHRTQWVEVTTSGGIDEVSLALTVDTYSSTGRSRAYISTPSALPVLTNHGLTVMPDHVRTGGGATVTPPNTHVASALDTALDGIMRRYGRATAEGVALVFEYPMHSHP